MEIFSFLKYTIQKNVDAKTILLKCTYYFKNFIDSSINIKKKCLFKENLILIIL